MAHELSFTTSNGRKLADMLSVRETPWHAEGTLLTTAPTLDEALRIANMDYTVEKRAVTFTTAGGGTKESGMAFVTVRADRDIELGGVGPGYKVVQNRDAFAATLAPLLDAGVMTIETAGVLRDGADAWILCKFNLDAFGPIAREVLGLGALETQPYALVKVNHSGRRNNEIALTFIRVVCANTLGFVESEVDGGHEQKNGMGTRAIGVRHTGDAQAKMVEAAQTLFADLVAKAEIVAKQYQMLKETKLDAAAFRAHVMLPAIGVHPTHRRGWNPEAVRADSVIERYEKKGAELVRLWEQGDGHTADHSAWEAYNGVVQAVDHDSDMFPTRSGVYRTAAMMHGYLRDMKDRTVVELVNHSEAIRDAKGSRTLLADILDRAEDKAALTHAA